MGIFTRFRDIIHSNINAMLEKAEDPEKLIKLMIQEMEDTLVEIKASCAGAMAARAKAQRALDELDGRVVEWGKKAELALSKGRDDLAREALVQKQMFEKEIETLKYEAAHLTTVVEKYHADIEQLESKLTVARKKHHVLAKRHIQAGQHRRTQSQIRHADHSDVLQRFEKFENRIERMEAEADLVNRVRKPTVEEEFTRLEKDETVEKELESLRRKMSGHKKAGVAE